MKMEERGRRMKGRGTHRNGGKMLENRGMDRRKVYENGGKMLKDGEKVCENRGKVPDNGIMLTYLLLFYLYLCTVCRNVYYE